MSKEEKSKTSKNISEVLTRTEGIFVIDISAAATARRACAGGGGDGGAGSIESQYNGRGPGSEEHTSPAGAANGFNTPSPRTLLPAQPWHVVAIQPPTLADARWLLVRAQRRLGHGS